MKIILLLISLVSSIFALTINESMIKVHSVLVPKILLMDYRIQDKITKSTMKIVIAYNDSEYKYAKSLKNRIDSRYKDGIKSYNISTKLVLYKDINNTKANLYYLFPTSKENIKSTIKQAHKNDALTFSYLKDDLQYGVMISLNISKKIKTVLNLDAIKKYKISLRPILIEISTIYKTSTNKLPSRLNVIKYNFYKIYTA